MPRWKYIQNAEILPLEKETHSFTNTFEDRNAPQFYDNMKNDQIQSVRILLDLETLHQRKTGIYCKIWRDREMGNVSINPLLPSHSFLLYWNHVGHPPEIISSNKDKWTVLHFLNFSCAYVSEVFFFKDLLNFQTVWFFFCSWDLSRGFTKENVKQFSVTPLAQQVRGTKKKNEIRRSPLLFYAPLKKIPLNSF